jgi:hypothetical protein
MINFFVAHVAITWSSQCQACTTNSSIEFEFVVANEVAKEAIWLRRLLFSIGVSQDKPTMLYSDNQNAI